MNPLRYEPPNVPSRYNPTACWGVDANKNYRAVFSSSKELEPGLYRFNYDGSTPSGVSISKQDISADDIIELDEPHYISIYDEFKRFWSLEDSFNRHGLVMKRGFLLHGPPGSGKTSFLVLLSNFVINNGGVVVSLNDPNLAKMGLHAIRSVEPKRHIVCIIEDIDNHISDPESEAAWLSLIDGDSAINRVVFVATTNHPENLSQRFLNRPSRFDQIVYIGMPSSASRRKYISAKVPDLPAAKLEEWVSRTEGFSFAHLRELITAVLILGHDLDETISRLSSMPKKRYRPKSRIELGFVQEAV